MRRIVGDWVCGLAVKQSVLILRPGDDRGRALWAGGKTDTLNNVVIVIMILYYKVQRLSLSVHLTRPGRPETTVAEPCARVVKQSTTTVFITSTAGGCTVKGSNCILLLSRVVIVNMKAGEREWEEWRKRFNDVADSSNQSTVY